MPPVLSQSPKQTTRRRGSLSSDGMFRITVNKALKVGAAGHLLFTGRATRSSTSLAAMGVA